MRTLVFFVSYIIICLFFESLGLCRIVPYFLQQFFLHTHTHRKMNVLWRKEKASSSSTSSLRSVEKTRDFFFFSKQFLPSPVRLDWPIILPELWRQRKLQKWANLSLLGKVRQIKEFVSLRLIYRERGVGSI